MNDVAVYFLEDRGMRNTMKTVMDDDAWASWLRLLAGAWKVDPRLQKANVKACIEIAQHAVEDVVDNEPDGGYLPAERHEAGGFDADAQRNAVFMQIHEAVQATLVEWMQQTDAAVVAVCHKLMSYSTHHIALMSWHRSC